jgi:hypothetical protein
MGDGFFRGEIGCNWVRIACLLAFCHALAGLSCLNSEAWQRGGFIPGAVLGAGTKII